MPMMQVADLPIGQQFYYSGKSEGPWKVIAHTEGGNAIVSRRTLDGIQSKIMYGREVHVPDEWITDGS